MCMSPRILFVKRLKGFISAMAFTQHVFRGRDRRLGVAEGRRYDLPLNNSPGNGFLVLLVALMTFLAVLALTASFALGGMTQRWSSGLENKITIEIPAENAGGEIFNSSKISKLKDKVKVLLEANPVIENFEIMDDAAIHSLVAPWLGEDFSMDEMPLPTLIAVEVSENTESFIASLSEKLAQIDPAIRLDTHEDWLGDLLELIGSLQFSTLLVTFIIALTGIIAIAGAIRSRMAEHKPDVELLHLMGASDGYISSQFQRHALILGFQGGVYGLVFGAGMLIFLSLLIGNAQSGLLPGFQLGMAHYVILLSLPVLACIIAATTARITVLRVLTRMP